MIRSKQFHKKALIVDLDNTIYPVKSIANNLFRELFELIQTDGRYKGDFHNLKEEIMRKPFQGVADQFHFHHDLFSKGINLLTKLTYNDKIIPYKDYTFIQSVPCHKYLVTTGFKKLQLSKIRQLNIRNHYKEIFIIDPLHTTKTKKEIFSKIIKDNDYKTSDLLVVGDDLDSEIAAAEALGIDSIVYAKEADIKSFSNENWIMSFEELAISVRV